MKSETDVGSLPVPTALVERLFDVGWIFRLLTLLLAVNWTLTLLCSEGLLTLPPRWIPQHGPEIVAVFVVAVFTAGVLMAFPGLVAWQITDMALSAVLGDERARDLDAGMVHVSRVRERARREKDTYWSEIADAALASRTARESRLRDGLIQWFTFLAFVVLDFGSPRSMLMGIATMAGVERSTQLAVFAYGTVIALWLWAVRFVGEEFASTTAVYHPALADELRRDRLARSQASQRLP